MKVKVFRLDAIMHVRIAQIYVIASQILNTNELNMILQSKGYTIHY